MPGPCGSGRPQSRAGRNRGGRWGQPPISQPGGGGCAAVALVTARREGGCTGDGAAWEGPLVPARPRPRGPPLLTLAAVGSFCALLPGLTPVRKEGTDIPAPGLVRLPREPGRAPGGGRSAGPAGSAAIQAVFCSRPRPRRAQSPALQPPPPVAAVAPAPRLPHPAPARPRRGHTPSTPAASTLRFVEPEPVWSPVTGAASRRPNPEH